MVQLCRASLMLIIALLLAACGSVATPIWEVSEDTPTTTASPTTEVLPTTEPAVAEIQPSNTPLPPTATETSIPPTATPTITLEPPTTTPMPASSTGSSAPRDGITVLVSLSDPEHGQELFNTYYDEAGYMCSTCHLVDSTERLLGPGLLGVGNMGEGGHEHGDHVRPEEAPERYLFNSITNPDLFVVEDYPDNLMPEVYADVFSEQDIYDIIAYLMTLK